MAHHIESDAHRSSLVAEVELGSTFRNETCDGAAATCDAKFCRKTLDHIARRSSRRRGDIVHRA